MFPKLNGSWAWRASSNKAGTGSGGQEPARSASSGCVDLFEAMDSVLRTHPEVGEYNQKI
jgi:phosphomannomutase/phosphoglucomutase